MTHDAKTDHTGTSAPASIDVRRAQRGDAAAFERLYREHVGRVYGLCLRMVADSGRAEELTQDVFVHAWNKLDRFAGRSAFSTWLHRLTVNLVISAQRSRKREQDRVDGNESEAVEQYADKAGMTGLAMDLENAIASLPEQARRVFVLYQLEGYAHQEVAETLGIAQGTSKAHLYRARQLLKESLQ